MPRNRSLPPHLEIRGTGYYWRRRLPRSLRDWGNALPQRSDKEIASAPKKVFLCFSLRSHFLRDAKILARRLTEMSDLVFAADAEITMAIVPEVQERLLETLARFEIEAFERTRALAGPRSHEAATLELRREEALQSVLQQAIWLGDAEVARQPLCHVAKQLGLAINEADENWKALAYEAIKVLLDISKSRSQRQQGIYEEPTVYFRRAINHAEPAPITRQAEPMACTPSPASLASQTADAPSPAPAPASFASELCAEESCKPVPEVEDPHSEAAHEARTQAASPTMQSLRNSTFLTPAIVPAGLETPEGFDEETWQNARVAARPPRILIDRKLLSEQSLAALEKVRGITLQEAIVLYFELLSLGYKAPFDKHQKRRAISEDEKSRPFEERLNEDKLGNYRMAIDFWPTALGDEPVDEIHVDELNDALELFWRVPANHGKSSKERGKFNIVELIEKADAQQAQLERAIAAAKASGASEQDIDKMRLNGNIPRISVATYIKHGRVLRSVGEMLWQIQLIDQNPFSICSWTNAEVKEFQSSEGQKKREPWDDRINDLWSTPVFTQPLDDVGEPLFWAPLIARLIGMRMEEILQLGPDDFGVDKGIPYLRVSHNLVNGLKTLSSARKLPIHPQLIELGLLKLVELRKKQGYIRLFPFLTRGKHKGAFSANFSKAFAYYRKTNDCYWPGLDFHALRTTFHHDLLGDDKSDAIRCRLMGHTYRDEGDRSYGQNLGIDKLAERMESVVVDLSMIRRPFQDDHSDAPQQDRKPHLRVVG